MVKYLLLLAAFLAGASAQQNLLQLQVLHATGFGGACLNCNSLQCYSLLTNCPYYRERLFYQDACSALNRLPPIVIPRVCTYLNYVREEGAVLKLGGYQCLCQNGEFSQCTPVQDNTIAQVISEDPNPPNNQWVSVFSDLIELDEYKDIYDLLNNASNTLTVFIPTDEALLKFVDDNSLDLVADAPAIKAVLSYHVATTGGFSATLLSGVPDLLMANNETVVFTREIVTGPFGTPYYGPLRVNNATFVTSDIIASNGLIHIIDGVLLPEEIPAANSLYRVFEVNPEFLTFYAVISSPGYEALRDYFSDISVTCTAFIPANVVLETFFTVNSVNPFDGDPATQSLVIQIFLRHVLNGQAVLSVDIPLGLTDFVALSNQTNTLIRNQFTANIVVNPGGAIVVAPDFLGSNGVAHSVGAVIIT